MSPPAPLSRGLCRPGGVESVKRAEELLPPDEQVRLAECAREPQHAPGSVQPHGVLLVADAASGELVQVSANAGDLLGEPVDHLLGRPLESVLGTQAVAAVRRAAVSAVPGASVAPVTTRLADRDVDLVAHESEGLLLVEVEPTGAADEELLFWLGRAMQRVAAAGDMQALCDAAVQEVRRLTGFDRVMLYRFHPDGHGEVVAEDRAEDLSPYVGLHYPASDIPEQARRLYARNPVRVIPDARAAPVPLVTHAGRDSAEPLDLSGAQLRSVSPHHLEFLRNMGSAASMSLSLVADGELLGMISLGHRKPRHVDYRMRDTCALLAQQVTLLLLARERTEEFRRRLRHQEVRAELVSQAAADDDVTAALLRPPVTLFDIVPADGVLVSLESQLARAGQVPDDDAVRALVEAVRAEPGLADGTFASEALAEDHPHLAALLPSVAGVAVVAMPASDDHLVWFRGEVAQTVDWLGDQSPENRATPLSPRNSFHLWRQTVRGRSLPWDKRALAEAAELGRDLSGVLLRRAEARLAHLGLHDPLTGLPNRRLFLDRLQHALHRHARGATAAVLFVDLDRFKVVNDSLGHEVGDRVLVRAAQLIIASVREADTVARLGGDEFVVLCEDVDPDAVRAMADRLVADLQQPLEVDGHDLRVSASVGVAVAAGHRAAADLLREADIAMYQAKEQGRNQVSPFEAGMRYRALRRLDLDQALRGGLQRDELLLHYQPIVRAADGEVRGLEALLRWQRPDTGLVPPDQFVPLAEDTGFIVPLGEWVLEQALRQLAAWTADGLVVPELTLAVNVSARQLLDPGLPAAVLGLLEETGVAPERLHLEITESVWMSERPVSNEVVHRLADFGVALVIDDFGTGYSSLAYLQELPARQLKIDRSFVRRLGDEPRHRSLVAAMVGLAQEFGLQSVAEGVETPHQQRLVTELGCELAQGFLFGRPADAQDTARLLIQH